MPSEKLNPDIAIKKTIQPDLETERLRRDIFRPDMEKFKLFTKMLRTNALFNRAKVTHK
jgi:hypothetical protein